MLLERVNAAGGVVFYISPLLQGIGVAHAFSTRIGGVSVGAFASLNLGNPGGCAMQDDVWAIRDNYGRLTEAAGLSGRRLERVKQVHGSRVVCVGYADDRGEPLAADAMIADDPACTLSVRVADCVPILLASADGRRVAAVHAGWRGVVAGVVAGVVTEMRVADRGAIIAAIGPCISMEAFEVGEEVVRAFLRLFGDKAPITRDTTGKGHVDLRQAVRLQLLGVGISAQRIDTCDRCTHRDEGEFFSHRREKGITGRMAAVVSARA